MRLIELFNENILNIDMGLVVKDEEGHEVHVENAIYAPFVISRDIVNREINNITTGHDFSITIIINCTFNGC